MSSPTTDSFLLWLPNIRNRTVYNYSTSQTTLQPSDNFKSHSLPAGPLEQREAFESRFDGDLLHVDFTCSCVI